MNLLPSRAMGPINLPNRALIVSRCRAESRCVPSPLTAGHCSQRSGAGLIIARTTMATRAHGALLRSESGIYSDEHINEGRAVTETDHGTGDRIFPWLWHGRRACHPFMKKGARPTAPGATPITNDMVHTPDGELPHVTPRELCDDEIPGFVIGFGRVAASADAAAFDGVEVNDALGHPLSELVRNGSKRRPGCHGGLFENRTRLIDEFVDASIAVRRPSARSASPGCAQRSKARPIPQPRSRRQHRLPDSGLAKHISESPWNHETEPCNP